jgi:hypothetical protein
MITSKEISQLQEMPREFRDSVGEELRNASIPWKEAYSDYQSGGWYVAQLVNSSGRTDQLKIDGGEPVPTPLLEQFPSISRFLQDTPLDVRIARLASISPGSWMHEHNDDVGIQEQRQRLHIPIVTNKRAVLCFDGAHVHLDSGYLWKLDHERVPHAAANYGDDSRVHLILDCRVNAALKELMARETINGELVERLPVLEETERQQLIASARALITEGNVKQGEDLLLETFCKYDLGGRSCYDLLLAAYIDIEGAEDRARLWRDRLREVRGRETHL